MNEYKTADYFLTLDKTLGLPTMMIPYLARVKATLSRLGSLRNPMPWCSLVPALKGIYTSHLNLLKLADSKKT